MGGPRVSLRGAQQEHASSTPATEQGWEGDTGVFVPLAGLIKRQPLSPGLVRLTSLAESLPSRQTAGDAAVPGGGTKARAASRTRPSALPGSPQPLCACLGLGWGEYSWDPTTH